MKRRGFFGLMAGAAVAGPGIAKEAVAKGMADLSLMGVSGGFVGGGAPSPGFGGFANMLEQGLQYGSPEWAAQGLAKIAGRSAAQHAFRKKSLGVHQLDPDIVNMRSIALHRKIGMQRDREYERQLESERDGFNGWLNGWFADN